MVVEALAKANHIYKFEEIVGDLDRFCEVRSCRCQHRLLVVECTIRLSKQFAEWPSMLFHIMTSS